MGSMLNFVFRVFKDISNCGKKQQKRIEKKHASMEPSSQQVLFVQKIPTPRVSLDPWEGQNLHQ